MSEIDSNNIHKKCLYGLLNLLLDYLNQYKIFYFIDGGSLLGAIREFDIIEHDDDIDLGVLDSDYHKLTNFLDELDGTEIYIDNYIFDVHVLYQNSILKVYIPQYKEIFKSEKMSPCIDIFKWTIEDNKYQLLPKEFRVQFPNCYYEYKEMYPRNNYYLGDIEVKGANQCKPYLFRYYGDDCLKVKKKYLRDELGFKNEFVIIE